MKTHDLLFPELLLVVLSVAGPIDAGTAENEILLAAEGITSWTTKPHAVYHNGRTYFGYQNQRHVEVNYLDHTAGKIGTLVVVHTYTYDDDHGTPSLFIVPAGKHAGKLVILYAHHNDPLYSCRSTNAEDISQWDPPVVVDGGRCNYPNVRRRYLVGSDPPGDPR